MVGIRVVSLSLEINSCLEISGVRLLDRAIFQEFLGLYTKRLKNFGNNPEEPHRMSSFASSR